MAADPNEGKDEVSPEEGVMSLRRIIFTWFVVAMAMIANGIFRETVLVQAMGRQGADAVSIALGIVVMLAVTRPFLIRWASPGTKGLLRIGLLWLAMTLVFEFAFGHYVDRKSWAEIGAQYRVWDGEMWPIALLTIVAAPLLWVRAPGRHAVRNSPSGSFAKSSAHRL